MSTEISFKLAMAVASGRKEGPHNTSREAVLARLLAKRAAAYRAELVDLERILRSQIEWGLPIHTAVGSADPTDTENS